MLVPVSREEGHGGRDHGGSDDVWCLQLQGDDQLLPGRVPLLVLQGPGKYIMNKQRKRTEHKDYAG